MDFEALLKDAALVGVAVGVIAMAAVLLYAFSQYLMRPAVTVAATTKIGVGFQLP